MLLWKETYCDNCGASPPPRNSGEREWDSWPRPPGGFLDLGYSSSWFCFRGTLTYEHHRCGNGLLVHILIAEGYAGRGIDLRARQSWASYPTATQECLLVRALDPTAHPSSADEDGQEDAPIPPDCFIIANHADELTPWTPVLAALRGASGFLSLPCCAWTFDSRFQRTTRSDPFGFLFEGLQFSSIPSAEDVSDESRFIEELALGGDGSHTSGYSAYRIWLAKLNVACGWKVECDTLRIPSTRNWAIVGAGCSLQTLYHNANTVRRSY